MEADEQPFSPVNSQASVATKISSATLAGLLISLFAMVMIRYAVAFFVPEITFASAILKETLIWASAAALLVIIRRGERLSFRSIGLGTCRWWKSIAWGLVIAIVSAESSAALLISRDADTVRVRRIREIAALVNYTDRFARWSGGRIILPRLRH
jgi:hypothetical protein